MPAGFPGEGPGLKAWTLVPIHSRLESWALHVALNLQPSVFSGSARLWISDVSFSTWSFSLSRNSDEAA